MQPALLDASIYISALRKGSVGALSLRRLASDAPLWLSSVVLEELYAGAGDRQWRVIERLERDFDRAKRILAPNLSDWTRAGRMLAHLVAKYGYEQIGQGRLTNDALIERRSDWYPGANRERTGLPPACRISSVSVASGQHLGYPWECLSSFGVCVERQDRKFRENLNAP